MLMFMLFSTLVTGWLIGAMMYAARRLRGWPAAFCQGTLDLLLGPGWYPAEALLGASLGAPLGCMAGAVFGALLNQGASDIAFGWAMIGAIIGGLIMGHKFAGRPLITSIWHYSKARSQDKSPFDNDS